MWPFTKPTSFDHRTFCTKVYYSALTTRPRHLSMISVYSVSIFWYFPSPHSVILFSYYTGINLSHSAPPGFLSSTPVRCEIVIDCSTCTSLTHLGKLFVNNNKAYLVRSPVLLFGYILRYHTIGLVCIIWMLFHWGDKLVDKLVTDWPHLILTDLQAGQGNKSFPCKVSQNENVWKM